MLWYHVLLLVIGLVFWICMCCKYGCECHCNDTYENIDETPCCGCTQNFIHSVLMGLVPELFSKHVLKHEQQSEQESEQQSPGQATQNPNGQATPNHKEILLIADKEFDENSKTRKACCYTYSYFVTICVFAFVWFVLVGFEYRIYRKTGTCNDIDVLDVSYSCFRVENGKPGEHINCTIGKDPNITVFCYLHSPNPGAIGVGFSFARLILFGVTLYFKFTIKLAETSRGCVVFVQVILFIVAVTGIIILLPLIHYVQEINIYIYFFQGNATLRWASYVLLVLCKNASCPGFSSLA